MRKDKLAIVTIFALVAGGVVVMQYLKGNGIPPAGPPLKPSTAGEFRGISLQLHSAHPRNPYEDYVDEISQTGANTINLAVHAYQENGTSNMISMRKDRGPNDDRLRGLIRHARGRGMRVMLMPIVLLDKPNEDEWRGSLKPSDWDSWWEDYYTFVKHYAAIAQQEGVEAFLVGSELLSTEDQTDRWVKLIAQVRKIYSGRLTYSSNWDSYKKVGFWDKLDMIGMTTYNDLVGDKKPSPAVLRESWRRIRNDILTWRNRYYPNHQILFTEVGWPDIVTAAKYAWDYYRSKEEDQSLQAMCFTSFFETWANDDAVAGYLVWEWRNHPNHHKERGYVPYGREKTIKVLQHYFTLPARSASGPALSRPGTLPATAPTLRDTPPPPLTDPPPPPDAADMESHPDD